METHDGIHSNGTTHGWHSQYLKYQTVSHLLLEIWTTDTVYGLVGAMLSGIIAAVTYECIHEYLRYLKHKALLRAKGSQCCGAVVFTCWEKFVLSIVQMIRVTIGYFMMLCVMTMNIWIFIAVVVGAAIGYGVGKPLVANLIRDIVTSHGYKIARVDQAASTSKSYRASQRSSSWRYQPIGVNDNADGRLMEILAGIEDRTGTSNNAQDRRGDKETKDDGDEIIWIRRSFAELEESQSSEVFSSEPEVNVVQPNVQLRPKNNPLPSTSTRANESSSSLNSSGRFRSTSKAINDSFRSEGNESVQSVMIRNDSYTLEYDSYERRKRSKTKRKSAKSLDRSSSAPPSRFKPISKQISRQQSFNTNSFELG